MQVLSKRAFQELANYRGAACISIYLPTHRAGMAVNRREDEILFKNQLRDITNHLETLDFSPLEIEAYLQPAKALLENSTFWNNLSDGLAVFLGDHFFKHYKLPIKFDAYTYIADHFYLKPTMPVLNDDGHFYLLALSLEEVRFFEATQHHIKELYVEDITPGRLEEVVGYDYEEKSLQFRSAQKGAGGAIFHGHGEESEEERNEMRRYFRAINEGLMKVLRDETAPLVVACVDYLFPIYREENDYKQLHPENVSGSPDRVGENELHEKAWQVLEPAFRREREEQVKRFRELMSTAKVATQLTDVLPAAHRGKVDVLFLRRDGEVYGVFDVESQEIRRDDEKQLDNVALLNQTAIKTLEQGGRVYLVDAEEMPTEEAMVNAIFRF